LSVENVMKSWGSVFSSSALFTQTNAIGDGIRQCTVGLTTTATITTRDWQASYRLSSFSQPLFLFRSCISCSLFIYFFSFSLFLNFSLKHKHTHTHKHTLCFVYLSLLPLFFSFSTSSERFPKFWEYLNITLRR